MGEPARQHEENPPENTPQISQTAVQDTPPVGKSSKTAKVGYLALFSCLTIFSPMVLIDELKHGNRTDRLVVFGLAGLVMLLLSWYQLKSIREDWDDKAEKEFQDRCFSAAFGMTWKIIKLVLIVSVVALMATAIFNGFQWLSNIPSWAAVIIVLLLIRVF